MRGISFYLITLTQLSIIILSPRENLTSSSNYSYKATSSYFKIFNVNSINTFHTMWCEEISENTTTPEIKLIVSGKSPRKLTSSYFTDVNG